MRPKSPFETPQTRMMKSFKLILLALLPLMAVSVRIMGENGAVLIDEDFSEDDDMVQLTGQGRRMYEGYKLLRAKPVAQKDVDTINFIRHAIVDFWTPLPRSLPSPTEGSAPLNVDMLVNPLHLEQVMGYFNCSGLDYEVAIENLQSAIETENVNTEFDEDDVLVGRPGFCTDEVGLNFHTYQRYDRMQAYLKCLSNRHGSSKVQLFNIGRTYEGRKMEVIRIGTNKNNPAIWIDGGIHAREWISPASVLFMIYQLVENYGDPANKQLVDSYNFYIIPSVNPDGYEYSHDHDRLWRKTRSKHLTPYGRTCYGADPNRNWGYEWGGLGASENHCSDTYRGPTPFSESETRNVRDFIQGTIPSGSLRLYLTFHSYGQYILYPWGFSDVQQLPPNVNALKKMGNNAAAAMKRVNGNEYSVGSAAGLLYPASGGSDDWAKGFMNVDYSFTIELPDTGRYGFILPASRIQRTAVEAFEGVKAMVRGL